MKKRIVVLLEDDEITALQGLARRELRLPWQQAAFIICRALEEEGVIETQDHVVPAVADDDIKSQEEIQHA